MNSWTVTALGDVLTVKHGYAFKGQYFDQGGTVRLVTPGNFHERGGFRDRGAAQRSYVGPVPTDYLLSPRSLVTAMTEQSSGLLGSAALIPDDDFTWLHNQRIGLVVPRQGAAYKNYIYYLFNSPAIRDRLSETATGTKVRHTAPNRIEAICIQLPPYVDQRRIAVILAAFDELIEINERRIELLEDLARSLYREWFVHFRFPGHDTVELIESERGPIPAGWKIRPLDDVAAVNRESIKAVNIPDPFLYLDISAVGVGGFEVPSVRPAAEAPGRARRRASDGDIVWATVRPNRRAHAQIHNPPPNLVVSTGLAVLSPVAVPPSFLFEYTASEAFSSYLVGRASGSAYPAVRPKDFGNAPVVVPPQSLLERFDATVDPIQRLRSDLRRQNQQFASTRDLLLPRLVTGRLDISDVDLGVLTPAEIE
ncbi:MAG: restriction endonuclease subunit S [Solirubrobacterales bacterium]